MFQTASPDGVCRLKVAQVVNDSWIFAHWESKILHVTLYGDLHSQNTCLLFCQLFPAILVDLVSSCLTALLVESTNYFFVIQYLTDLTTKPTREREGYVIIAIFAEFCHDCILFCCRSVLATELDRFFYKLNIAQSQFDQLPINIFACVCSKLLGVCRINSLANAGNRALFGPTN